MDLVKNNKYLICAGLSTLSLFLTSISTIFLTRSNITPTDTDTTVKAEIENIKGGINCERIHLSSRGI